MTGPAAAAEPLGQAEEQRVVQELRRIRETPAPADRSGAGCVTAMVALIALVFMPVLSRALPVGSGALLALGAALLAVVVGGTVVGFMGGRSAGKRAARGVDEAVESLVAAWSAGDHEAARSAMLRVLTGAVRSVGPARVRVYEPDAVAARLGDALPYVRSVERFLVERGEIDPVFSGPHGPDERITTSH